MLQKQKLNQAVEILNELDIDLWITIARETDMNTEPVLPFICKSGVHYVTAIAVSKSGKSYGISGFLDAPGLAQQNIYDEIIEFKTDMSEGIETLISKEKPKKIALNYSEGDVAADGLTVGLYRSLLKWFEKAGFDGEIVSSETLIVKLRGRKTEDEYNRVMKAVKIAEQIFEDAKDYIKAGLTQIEIHDWFVERTKYYGYVTSWEEDQCPGVMAGPKIELGHTAPSDDIVTEPGDVVTVDFGVLADEYCSDIQRVYYILKDNETEVPEHIVKVFEDVKASVDAGVALIKPGADPVAVDAAAADKIVELGYPRFQFGFGHNVGRACHDGGIRFARDNGVDLLVEEGQIMTVDANVKSDRGYVGQEDMVYVTKDGCKFMTTRQMEIFKVK